ncbi:MAG: glycosyltransferase family 39 protein [Chloroflexi bacterium]|nr:glycosyltransferase family 39 protein [Chloroflexota bacterium]
MSVRRAHLIPLLLWSLVCALFFASLLRGTTHLPDGDFLGQFHAEAVYQGRALLGDDAGGQGLLWSPASYGGFPFAADPQTAVFYPPRWLTLLLFQPWDFPVYALQLEAIAHIWLAGVFTYLLAYDMTRRCSAASLAALAFGLGGYLTAYPMLQLAVLESVIWLPLVLWLLRRATAVSRPVPWLVAAGVGLGLSALAGHPQTFLHVSYAAAAYFLFLAVRAGWSWCTLGKLGAVVMGTALGTAGAALLPTLHYMFYTTRRSVSYQFTASGLPLEDYVQLMLPGLRSHWVPEYSGVAALLLVLVAWYGRRARSTTAPQTAEITFWAGMALVAGWLALGDNGILFQAAYGLLPGFRLFQQQERLLSLVSLSVALLAALGTAVWLQADSPSRRRLLWQSSLTTAVFLLAAGLYALADPHISARPWPILWGRQVVLLGISALLLGAHLVAAQRSPARGRAILLLLIPLLAADLFVNTAGSVDRRPGSPAAFWPQTAWMQQLRAELPPLARIDSQNLLHANLGAVYNLEDVGGISPLKPLWLGTLGTLPRERFWQLLGVTHVLSHEAPTANAEAIAPIRQHIYPERRIEAQVWRLPPPLPRAWLSYRPVVVDGEAAASQTLADPAFNPAEQVVLHEAIPDLTGIQPPERPPMVAASRLGRGTLRLDVATETAAILVLSEWRYPGWRAWVNGQPADLFPADYAFLGLRLPAGRHQVDVAFRPWDVPVGMALSLLTLITAVLLAWRWQPEVVITGPPNRTPPLTRSPRRIVEATQLVAVGRRLFAHSLPVLMLLIWLAFGLRLHTLGSQELRGDEAYGYPFLRLPLVEMLRAIAALGEEHPPLHYIMLNGWIRLVGDSEFAMRFLAVIPGVLLLPLLWQLGRRWHGRSLGLLLAVIAAVSQSLVWLGQDVRNQYVMVIFFGSLATWLFQRALERPRRAAWAWYALACALTIYSHYYGIFVLLAHGLALLVLPAYRRHLLAYGLSGLAAALLFAPWLLVTFSGWVVQLTNPSQIELAPYLQRVGRELVTGPAFPPGPGRWLFLAALLLSFWGWRAIWARDRVTAVILGAWLWGALGGVFLVLLRRSIFNAYYVSPAAPAWWALVGLGILSLWQGRSRWAKGLAVGSALALLLAAGWSLGNYYGRPTEYGRTQGYRSLAAHVMRQQMDNDLFVANFPDPALVYYLRHLDVPYLMQPADVGAPPEAVEQSLAELAGQHDRLWFVPEAGDEWDRTAVVHRWLDYHTLIEASSSFQQLTLTAYRPAHAVDEVMVPVGLPVGDWAELEGYYITVGGAPHTALRPGAEVAVTLIWRALAPAPADYTMFVHLLDADGRLIAQHDGAPLFGTRPTTTWLPGERLLDRHTLTVPETAVVDVAQLWTGLYDSQSLERLPWGDGQDALPLPGPMYPPEAEQR